MAPVGTDKGYWYINLDVQLDIPIHAVSNSWGEFQAQIECQLDNQWSPGTTELTIVSQEQQDFTNANSLNDVVTDYIDGQVIRQASVTHEIDFIVCYYIDIYRTSYVTELTFSIYDNDLMVLKINDALSGVTSTPSNLMCDVTAADAT